MMIARWTWYERKNHRKKESFAFSHIRIDIDENDGVCVCFFFLFLFFSSPNFDLDVSLKHSRVNWNVGGDDDDDDEISSVRVWRVWEWNVLSRYDSNVAFHCNRNTKSKCTPSQVKRYEAAKIKNITRTQIWNKITVELKKMTSFIFTGWDWKYLFTCQTTYSVHGKHIWR